MKTSSVLQAAFPVIKATGTRNLDEDVAEAERKAIDSLARYKFVMFGYHAAVWVTLNRISGGARPNPFRTLVMKAREMKRDFKEV